MLPARKQLAPLLRFTSSKSGESMLGLADYVGRAQPGQKSIYYIAADSLAAAASAPFVEQLIKKDLEVRRPLEPEQAHTHAAPGRALHASRPEERLQHQPASGACGLKRPPRACTMLRHRLPL